MVENACSHRYNVEKGKSREMAFSAKLGYSSTIPCQKTASDMQLFSNLTFHVESADIWINLSCSIAVQSSSSSLSANLTGDTIQSQSYVERYGKHLSTVSLSCSKWFRIRFLRAPGSLPAACWREGKFITSSFWSWFLWNQLCGSLSSCQLRPRW